LDIQKIIKGEKGKSFNGEGDPNALERKKGERKKTANGLRRWNAADLSPKNRLWGSRRNFTVERRKELTKTSPPVSGKEENPGRFNGWKGEGKE